MHNLLEGKYSVLGNFSGWNTFSKIVALIVKEDRIRLEVDKCFYCLPLLLGCQAGHLIWGSPNKGCEETKIIVLPNECCIIPLCHLKCRETHTQNLKTWGFPYKLYSYLSSPPCNKKSVYHLLFHYTWKHILTSYQSALCWS